jgi:lipopolysaccharide transport system ATP-binding protein
VGTGFHPELTGRENVLFNGAVLGMRRAEVLRKFDEIVEFAQIADFIDTPVKRYSSGMSMRLAFSVAAHLEPEVMLVDEVLAVGDNEFQRRCLNRIIDIAEEGRTVVFVSHNMGTVERVCNRAILLRDGEVVADGPAQDVVHHYHSLAIPDADAAGPVSIDDLEAPRFLRWKMDSPEAVGEYTVVSGAGCTITFTLAVPKPMRDAFVGMGMYTDANVLAMALSGYDLAGECIDLERGLYDVSFHVPSLPLGRGRYHVRVSLLQFNGARVASWNAAPGLEIVRRRESTQIPPPLEGILVTDGRFTVAPAASELGASPADLRR